MNMNKRCLNIRTGGVIFIFLAVAGCATQVRTPDVGASDHARGQALTGSRIPVVQTTGHVVRMEAREYRETQPPRQLKDGGF